MKPNRLLIIVGILATVLLSLACAAGPSIANATQPAQGPVQPTLAIATAQPTAAPLSCSAEGYEEFKKGVTIYIPDQDDKDIAKMESDGKNLIVTFLATNEIETYTLPQTDQSTVGVFNVTMEVPMFDGRVMATQFIMLVCGTHVYFPTTADTTTIK